MPTQKSVIEKRAVGPSVSPSNALRIVQRLIDKARELQSKEDLEQSDVNAFNVTARDFLTRAFGSASQNIDAVVHASGTGGLRIGMTSEDLRIFHRSALVNKAKILQSCLDQLQMEIELDPLAAEPDPISSSKSGEAMHKVFIVHGHNEAVKLATARLLEKLGLQAVILHEQPNSGRTIIQKFTDHADVHFAVVLMTADDVGKAVNADALQGRARQNVVLELGYFLGRLGPGKVCALYESGVEIPSDYQGVLFTPIDSAGAWRFLLVKELRAAGFAVSADAL